MGSLDNQEGCHSDHERLGMDLFSKKVTKPHTDLSGRIKVKTSRGGSFGWCAGC